MTVKEEKGDRLKLLNVLKVEGQKIGMTARMEICVQIIRWMQMMRRPQISEDAVGLTNRQVTPKEPND